MKVAEMYNKPVVINVDEDEGSAEGYVINSNAVQIENWFAKHHISNEELIAEIRKKYQRIAFLNNINVDDEFKNQGYGNFLIDSFIENAGYEGANAILLIADIAESQSEGFNLVDWYSRKGFQVVQQTSSGPLMVLEL